MVTPLRDGMNLSPRYVASQDQDPGVLSPSRFAGAAEELGEAADRQSVHIDATAEGDPRRPRDEHRRAPPERHEA
jgi:trehalose-6-phosphate synthase